MANMEVFKKWEWKYIEASKMEMTDNEGLDGIYQLVMNDLNL